METHNCPTCNGTKKQTVIAQLYTEGGFTPQPPVIMDCFNCKGKGFLTPEEVEYKEAQKKIWCSCGVDAGVTHHEDGNDQEYPGGFTCNKHHYSCNNCGLIQQIG